MSILKALLKHTNVELEDADLDQPVTLCKDGSIASLRDLISQRGSSSVRAALGVSGRRGASLSTLAVKELTETDLEQLTLEVIEKSDPDRSLAIVGQGTFTKEQLKREVKKHSEAGTRFVSAIRQHAQFLEEALRAGKIKAKKSKQDTIVLPDFDF